MFTLRLTATLGLWVLMAGCASDDTTMPPPVGNGGITGIITDANGNGYQDIRVTFKKGLEVLAQTTDEEGIYILNNVSVGSYQVNFVPPLGTQAIGDNPASVEISEGNILEKNFTFELLPTPATLVLGATDPLNEVTDALGNVPTQPEDLLFTPLIFEEPLGELHPILAPDGHQITLEEWQLAQGVAQVWCDGSTTKYLMEFTGLIPGGVYTIWNQIFNRQIRPTEGINVDTDISDAGALGNGSINLMVASENGEAQLEVEANPGPLSMFGSQPSCAITNIPGFLLVVNYHIDGKSHGPVPGPDKDDVAHLLIYL